MIDLTKFTKEERKRLASNWYDKVNRDYVREAERAIHTTYVVSERECLTEPNWEEETLFNKPATIFIIPTDSISMLFKHNMMHPKISVGVLNFASYKHPGGMFFNGSSAQEEALCHHSVLIQALNAMKDTYYKPHIKLDHNGLYGSDMIFSDNVAFMDRVVNKDLEEVEVRSVTEASVITAAAPNVKAYDKKGYDSENSAEYSTALDHRIIGVLTTALKTGQFDLICGAFGCGVFGNDPHIVADTFFHYLSNMFLYRFNRVYFPIPRSFHNNNFQAFCEVGQNYNVKILNSLEEYE